MYVIYANAVARGASSAGLGVSPVQQIKSGSDGNDPSLGARNW